MGRNVRIRKPRNLSAVNYKYSIKFLSIVTNRHLLVDYLTSRGLRFEPWLLSRAVKHQKLKQGKQNVKLLFYLPLKSMGRLASSSVIESMFSSNFRNNGRYNHCATNIEPPFSTQIWGCQGGEFNFHSKGGEVIRLFSCDVMNILKSKLLKPIEAVVLAMQIVVVNFRRKC